jgi:hypothetical protein
MKIDNLKGGINKMERKYMLGVFAFAMVALLGLGVVSANGFGMGRGDLSEEDQAQMDAHREAMQNAVETGDYAAWEGLMQERLAEMENSISEETFAEIQARYAEREEFREAMVAAKKSGDWSEIEALKEEFGIEGKGYGQDKVQGQGQHMRNGSGNGAGCMRQ